MTDKLREKIESLYDEKMAEIGDALAEDSEDEKPVRPIKEEQLADSTEEPEVEEEAADPAPDDTEEDVDITDPPKRGDYTDLLHPEPFNQEERAAFDRLPTREAKRLVKGLVERLRLSHQRTMGSKLTQLNEEYEKAVGEYKGLDKIRSQYQHRFTDGTTPLTALENSLEWDEALDNNPHAAIAELMEQYGVHPQDFLNGQRNFQPSQPQVIPGLSKLETEIQALKQERLEERKRQVISQIDNDLATFAAAKDAEGNPAYPLLQYVAPHMSGKIAQLKKAYPGATNLQYLQAAYTDVVADFPELQALAKPKQEKKPAKKPTSLVGKSNGKAGKVVEPKKDLRTVIEEEYDRLTSS